MIGDDDIDAKASKIQEAAVMDFLCEFPLQTLIRLHEGGRARV
jgi:hypothetical protein